jgi:hypothetical protein
LVVGRVVAPETKEEKKKSVRDIACGGTSLHPLGVVGDALAGLLDAEEEHLLAHEELAVPQLGRDALLDAVLHGGVVRLRPSVLVDQQGDVHPLPLARPGATRARNARR